MKRPSWIIDRLRAKLPSDASDPEFAPLSGPIDSDADGRDTFRFAPELFEIRSDVISELSDHGFEWLTHYSSVDPIHDCYGIEVCGIRERDDAESILYILVRMFPDWRPG